MENDANPLLNRIFLVFCFTLELAVVMGGLVASVLTAIVYVVPWVLLFSFHKKFRSSKKAIHFSNLIWGGSVVTMVLAEITTSSLLMMTSTGVFVLATMIVTTLNLIKAITRHYVRKTC